jgi:hypothetical protein
MKTTMNARRSRPPILAPTPIPTLAPVLMPWLLIDVDVEEEVKVVGI